MDNENKGETLKPDIGGTHSTGTLITPMPSTDAPTEPDSVKETRTDDSEEVTLTKGKLRGILADFDEKLKARDKDIDLLKRASDKSLLSKEMAKDAAAGQNIGRTMRLSTVNNKAVVGWRNLIDIAPYKVGNVWHEGKQHYEITLEDNSKIEYPSHAAFFDALYGNQVICDVISRKEKADGNVLVELKRQDTGETYEIGVQFVN